MRNVMSIGIGESSFAKKGQKMADAMSAEMKAAYFSDVMDLKTTGDVDKIARPHRLFRPFRYLIVGIFGLVANLYFSAIVALIFLIVSYTIARCINTGQSSSMFICIYISLMAIYIGINSYRAIKGDLAKKMLIKWAGLIDKKDISVGEFLGFSRNISRLKIELISTFFAIYIVWILQLTVVSWYASTQNGHDFFSPSDPTMMQFAYFWLYQSFDVIGENFPSTFGLLPPEVTVLSNTYFSKFVWLISISLWSGILAHVWAVVKFDFKTLRNKALTVAGAKKKDHNKKWAWLALVNIPK